jgi:hypothetical protein
MGRPAFAGGTVRERVRAAAARAQKFLRVTALPEIPPPPLYYRGVGRISERDGPYKVPWQISGSSFLTILATIHALSEQSRIFRNGKREEYMWRTERRYRRNFIRGFKEIK